MFLNKSDAISFDKALKKFCNLGETEWRDAASQYASKGAVDFAINVTHAFRQELRGGYSQELLEASGLSINSDPYSPVLNYLNGYFN